MAVPCDPELLRMKEIGAHRNQGAVRRRSAEGRALSRSSSWFQARNACAGALERSLRDILPIGPEEGQAEYIRTQVLKSLRHIRTDWQALVRYMLVLQWPCISDADLDALISMEEQVDAFLGRYASVDGHDIGASEMNIFIATDRPREAFADAANILRGSPRWGDLRAAYREALGGSYEILWPSSLSEFSVKLRKLAN